jgi:hypothetical protein
VRNDGKSVVETPQRFLDHPVFVVLIVSCALLVLFVGFALAQVFGESDSRDSEASSKAGPRFAGSYR